MWRQMYVTLLPIPAIFSTFLGVNMGSVANGRFPEATPMTQYANLIGYTTIGIATGLTYPVSFPLFGLYVATR